MGLWLGWVAVGTVFGLVNWAAAPFLTVPNPRAFESGLIRALLSLGLVVLQAVPQWLLLRPYVRGAAAWVPATLVGALAGNVLGLVASTIVLGAALASGVVHPTSQWLSSFNAAVGLVSLATMLAALGAAQAWVLRRAAERAWLWVVATVVSGAAVLVLRFDPDAGPATRAAESAAIAAFAGLALVWVLRDRLRVG